MECRLEFGIPGVSSGAPWMEKVRAEERDMLRNREDGT